MRLCPWLVLLFTPQEASLPLVPSPALSAEQQLALETLNAIRADPGGARFELEAALQREIAKGAQDCTDPRPLRAWRTVTPRGPLAPSQAITDVATAKAQDMLDNAWMGHVGPDGVGPNDRLRAAGFALDASLVQDDRRYLYSTEPGANQVEAVWIGLSAGRPAPTPDADLAAEAVRGLIVDRCVPDRGHREHLMSRAGLSLADREVGVGWATVQGDTLPWVDAAGYAATLSLFTHARSDETWFVMGVVYQDADGDGQYSLGEGVAGLPVVGPHARTETAEGGGWVLPSWQGDTGSVRIDGASYAYAIDGANVKIDVVR
jgi:hypothetical protein